jgi:hypothetical protein
MSAHCEEPMEFNMLIDGGQEVLRTGRQRIWQREQGKSDDYGDVAVAGG